MRRQPVVNFPVLLRSVQVHTRHLHSLHLSVESGENQLMPVRIFDANNKAISAQKIQCQIGDSGNPDREQLQLWF